MTCFFKNLGWLPAAPDNFSAQLAQASTGYDLRKLVNFSLDGNQLGKVTKKLAVLKKSQQDLTPLTEFNLGFISNTTSKLITPSLIATAIRFGFACNVIETEYNQVAQEAFSTHSAFDGHRLDAVLLAIDYHGLPLQSVPGDLNTAEKILVESIDYIKTVADGVHAKTGAQVLLQNLVPPVESYFGSFERMLPGTLSWLISRLNLKIENLASEHLTVVDVAGLASTLGLSTWHDPTLWNIAKLPFNQDYVPNYAEHVCRIIAARRGKSRRCLILDLDNTLWGGVIGDDGLEGILIGNGDPTGEAHLHVQQVALELRNRGVVLAVSSKNEEIIARQPFQKHPDMLLREEHIAVFQANWTDKASNIRAIATALSLGLDSIVFLDDNPAERMQVRKEIPEVAVPELPADPALYGRVLLAAGYFEAIGFSEEDSKRASFYQQNVQRAQLLNQSSDMEGYLASLQMEITFAPFDIAGRARIAQLISKSNQFNLTTKRYSELQIKLFEENDQYFTTQIRLKDVLGDNGMISVIICKKESTWWEIDTWLMSCRVLGRAVEEAVLQYIIASAKKTGALKLRGIYLPTDRNAIVKNHYKNLGFRNETGIDTAEQIWELDLTEEERKRLPMKVTYAV